MPSFDVVNNVDMQEVTNAVNNSNKELAQRYDFRGSNTAIELDANAGQIVIRSEDEMKIEAVQDIIVTHAMRRKLNADCLEFCEPQPAGGKTLRQEVLIHQGIEREIAQKLVFPKPVPLLRAPLRSDLPGPSLRHCPPAAPL